MLGQSTDFWGEYAAYETPTTIAQGPTEGPADASPDWTTALSQAVGYLTQWDMSRKLYDLNLERVQQGLEPIQAQAVTPGVTVGVSSDTQRLVLWVAAGIGALFLVRMLMK